MSKVFIKTNLLHFDGNIQISFLTTFSGTVLSKEVFLQYLHENIFALHLYTILFNKFIILKYNSWLLATTHLDFYKLVVHFSDKLYITLRKRKFSYYSNCSNKIIQNHNLLDEITLKTSS